MIENEQSIEQIRATRGGFFIEGDKENAVMLIHGIGGNASGLHPLAAYLHEQDGFSAEGVCLPGHASTPIEMKNYSYSDWLNKAQGEYDRLCQNYAHVSLVGISLGSLVCLALAEKKAPQGIVLISSPLYYGHPLIKLAGFVSLFKDYHYWKGLPPGMDPVKASLVCYDRVPFKSVEEMNHLQSLVRKNLSMLHCPLLALYGGKDHLVNPAKSLSFLSKKLPKESFESHFYPASYHGILWGEDREKAFQDVAAFLKK